MLSSDYNSSAKFRRRDPEPGGTPEPISRREMFEDILKAETRERL
jgi:hypothetical protein